MNTAAYAVETAFSLCLMILFIAWVAKETSYWIGYFREKKLEKIMKKNPAALDPRTRDEMEHYEYHFKGYEMIALAKAMTIAKAQCKLRRTETFEEGKPHIAAEWKQLSEIVEDLEQEFMNQIILK